jgi:hypothetical protein
MNNLSAFGILSQETAVNGNSKNGSILSAKNIIQAKETNGSHKQEEEEHDELQYLNLIRTIMKKGVTRGDRTGERKEFHLFPELNHNFVSIRRRHSVHFRSSNAIQLA